MNQIQDALEACRHRVGNITIGMSPGIRGDLLDQIDQALHALKSGKLVVVDGERLKNLLVWATNDTDQLRSFPEGTEPWIDKCYAYLTGQEASDETLS